MLWGNDSLTFKHYYRTDVMSDFLQPNSNKSGYNISFSDKYIIHNWDDGIDEQSCIQLYETGTSFSIFSMKSNHISHKEYINSIDKKHNLVVGKQFSFRGNPHYKYPFVVSSFDRSHSQFIEIEIDDTKPNPVTEFRWLKDTLITTYISEANETIIDTTVIDYNSEVKSHLLDKEKDLVQVNSNRKTKD